MLNKYPLQKYLLILTALVVGFIYSTPSLHPDSPAVQISGASTALQVIQADADRAAKALTDAGIAAKTNSLSKRGDLIRLAKRDDQLPTKEMVHRALSGDYVVVLNLAQVAPEWLRKLDGSSVKLGLDLSGGVHFLLEVGMDETVDVRLKVYGSEVKSLLYKERVHYRNLSIQDRAVQLGFTDSESLDKARSLIAKDFRDFEAVPEGRNGPQVLRVVLTQARLAKAREYFIKQNLTTVRNRVNEPGVSGPLMQHQGTNRVVAELPGVQDTVEAKRILGKTVNLELRLTAEPDALKSTTETFESRESRRPPVLLGRGAIITGDQVTDASTSFGESGRPQVGIRLGGHGGKLMNRVAYNNVGRSMMVAFIEQKLVTHCTKQMIDSIEREVMVPAFKGEKQVVSLMTIQPPLGDQFRITGLDSPGKSSELTLLLHAGDLAALMYFAEERTIDPSLRANNIARDVDAPLWDVLFVSLFIIIVYRFFGVIATVTLVFSMVTLVALMLVLGAALTLLDIAGIALTMGMAVDANALIFSRIREELINGMSIQRAIHEGFNRAFTVILDANLTSLLVGDILYAMGTGSVKGFAVTMSFGTITSMFAVIMITRAVVSLIFGGHNFKKLWIQGN